MTCPEHPQGGPMEFQQAAVPGAQALHQRIWHCRWCDRWWAYEDQEGVIDFRKRPEGWKP